jgi:ferredoxin
MAEIQPRDPGIEVYKKEPGTIILRIPRKDGIVYVKVITENCRCASCELTLDDGWEW